MHTRRAFLGASAGLVGGCVSAPGSSAAREVELLLNWKANGLHVPYFVAAEKGFYAAEDLDVTIQVGQGSDFSAKQVALGNNRLAVTSSDQLLTVNSRALQATAVAAVMQRSPVVLFTTQDVFGEALTEASALAGKTVGTGPGMVRKMTELFLKKRGVRAAVDLVRTGYDTVQRLLTGKIDAAAGVFGDAIHARHQDATVDSIPVASAIPAYGHVLGATPDFADRLGDAVRSFLRATARGAAWGQQRPAEAIDLLVDANEALTTQRAIQHETWTTMASEFMLSDAVASNGWGWNEPGPWSEVADILESADQLEGAVTLRDVWTNEYLDTDYRYIGDYVEEVGVNV